ncbi:(d)CMP kinase [Virgibacillus sp. W0430]|uniref:(d)CMP kinase n=1 Tax=Virgibacillus sp. W0430 TaxID=3391580 RepID=UPI003F485C88
MDKQQNEKIAIAIDGPAAAGKSTVAKLVAKQLSFVYIDTGAMYRAFTLKALNENIQLDDEQKLTELLKETTIDLHAEEDGQSVWLDGEDVTFAIRSDIVSKNVSIVAQSHNVREEMVSRQRAFSKRCSVVMDGRDIGTYVLPNADVKFFLIASVDERAKRRHEENLSKGFTSNLEELKSDIEKRDEMDSKRTIAPLIKADDALEINTTFLSIEQVAEKMVNEIDKKIKG